MRLFSLVYMQLICSYMTFLPLWWSPPVLRSTLFRAGDSTKWQGAMDVGACPTGFDMPSICPAEFLILVGRKPPTFGELANFLEDCRGNVSTVNFSYPSWPLLQNPCEPMAICADKDTWSILKFVWRWSHLSGYFLLATMFVYACFVWMFSCSPLEYEMLHPTEPENGPLKKKKTIWNQPFSGSMLNFQGVPFDFMFKGYTVWVARSPILLRDLWHLVLIRCCCGIFACVPSLHKLCSDLCWEE